MPDLPHTFPTLRQVPDNAGETRQCVAAIGAGFSRGLVPMPSQLFDARQRVQADLGCTASAAATDLYLWAGEIIQHLEQRNGVVPAKLLLAEALGITTDPRWRGANCDGPVEPRHRIVARFAREGRFESLWSLNWDCLQENALERVGLRRSTPGLDVPWKTHFSTFVTVADYAGLGGQQSLAVFKPHGCVHALTAARAALDKGNLEEARRLSSRFLITAAELTSPAFDPGKNQQHLFANLEIRLAQSPLIVLGWRVGEEYLCQLVEQRVGPVLQLRSLLVDQLSIVDWQFNDGGHLRVAAAFGCTQAQAHIPVEENGFTMDALWLWLQALYSVQQICAFNPNEPILDAAFVALQTPCVSHWVFPWADEWLPGWCRLCWQFGCVTCFHNNVPVPPEKLDLEAPDAHVPLDLKMPRPDLVAAGSLLATLWPEPTRWNFKAFPGAMFDAAQGQIVLPVPAWPSQFGHAERALKPIMDLWKPHFGIVRRVSLLGLDGGLQTANGAIEHWRQALARAIPTSRFADPQNVTTLNPNQL